MMTIHQAIDLAVWALDQERMKLSWGMKQAQTDIFAKRLTEVNQAIRLLTDLKERIGADGTQRMF
jgi:hypothetical protein